MRGRCEGFCTSVTMVWPLAHGSTRESGEHSIAKAVDFYALSWDFSEASMKSGRNSTTEKSAYYGHLVLRLMGCLVLLYTSRVICKGRMTMGGDHLQSQTLLGALWTPKLLNSKHFHRGWPRKPHEHRPNSEIGEVRLNKDTDSTQGGIGSLCSSLNCGIGSFYSCEASCRDVNPITL